MENTARNFALQLGSLITLYVSITSLVVLLWGIINMTYPDPALGYWGYENATSTIRFSIAMLIVFFPAYLVLTRMVNNVRRNEQGMYLNLTKWLIYLSLVVGGAVLLGDLVSIIYTYLEGDLVIRFMLKALSLLLVVGLAFTYYVLDARGYWKDHEQKSLQYGVAALVVVIVALVIGFNHTEPPADALAMRIDSDQINDLDAIQWRVAEYYRVNDMLPVNLEAVYGTGASIPSAAEGRDAYTYTKTGETSFELCAEFAFPTGQSDLEMARPIAFEKGTLVNPYNWDHGAGYTCFERVITPE